MRIYLMQHGEALSKEEDPDRPLSERGVRDARAVASFMSQARILLEAIHHSGKSRARQTAELVGEQLTPGLLPQSVEGLGANDPVGPEARAMEDWERDTLVVGHQPFLGKLTSLLVGGDETMHLVGFLPGSVACLEHDPETGWQVAWLVRPELLR